MLQRIDHIVIVARNLDEAMTDYQQAGFNVTPGGEHVGGATHNALVSFADGTYFELIAFRAPDQPQEHRWWPRLSRGEGIVDYALLSDDLAADAARVQANGLAFSGPNEGGRTRPDFQQLAWRSIVPEKGEEGSALPFVIQDVTPRELRVPGGEATRHRNGVSGVAGLTVVVADLAAAGAELADLLGNPWSSAETPEGRAMRFPIGQQWIQLLQPNEVGPAAEYLQRFGSAPYEVELTRGGEAEPGEGVLLPGSLRGARLRINR